METQVFRGSPHIFRNCSDDDLITDLEEQSTDNNLVVKSSNFFTDFPALDSHNTSFVYESMESIGIEDKQKDINTSDQSKKNLFCINNCQQIIKRLTADNEELKKLKKHLIVIEELNVELNKEKQRLETELKESKEVLEKKIIAKNRLIDDLKRSYYICESYNTSLHKELEVKKCEIIKLEDYIKETEDKLYYAETQLIEAQKSEENLMISYKSVKQAFTEEEDTKYKTIEQLHGVYVECAQQQNQIQELKEKICDLSREIADKDNELWFYKMRFDDSMHISNETTDRPSLDSQRESIYVSKTASEIPDYSFSVNEDESEYIYSDFNEGFQPKCWDQSSEYESLSDISNPLTEEKVIPPNNNPNANEDKPIANIIFYRFVRFLFLFFAKLPIKTILFVVFIVIWIKVLFGSVLVTRLPAYTSWEEIFYRIVSPYLTKVKVSKTQ